MQRSIHGHRETIASKKNDVRLVNPDLPRYAKGDTLTFAGVQASATPLHLEMRTGKRLLFRRSERCRMSRYTRALILAQQLVAKNTPYRRNGLRHVFEAPKEGTLISCVKSRIQRTLWKTYVRAPRGT
jgi:hypothetical protein